jgi:RimJ/RimL family protein N-acetyltransferase
MTAATDLLIRPVQPDDFAQWKPLWDGYNAFYGRHGDTALPDTVTQTTWQRFFDDHEPIYAIVAERDGLLLGIVHFLFHRSTTQVQMTCYLQDLFTAEAGLPRVYWHTHETNATAMKLYDTVAEKSGFVVYRKFL